MEGKGGSGDGIKEGKKHTFKGTAKAVSLAAKLSPKSQRKKEKADCNTAQLKVGMIDDLTTDNHCVSATHTIFWPLRCCKVS